ncbi:MAG: hypothetical protein COT17_01680 [Elusimicrobia bacterium CG08_land_8_20_14_0_20_51_18]|nr:MAG: hypothetical protein COT17_01680 [Elusimicrobia bacterium CG08_land_8_20_14_0_20_51_18]
MEKIYKKVAALYDSKRDDLNKYLAYDGIIHHHNGLLPGEFKGSLKAEQEKLRKVLHEAETRLSRLAIKKLSLRDGSRILDAGCGRGGNAVLMASGRKNVRVKAVNISDYQLGEVRRVIRAKKLSGRVKVFKMSMEELSFKKGSFDRVLACESTEHADLSRFFASLSGVAKKKARLVIVAWTSNPSGKKGLAELSRVNRAYVTRMQDYLEIPAAHGWVLREKIDLTAGTFFYWKLRKDSAVKSGTEDLMTGVFGKRLATYMLYVYDFIE